MQRQNLSDKSHRCDRHSFAWSRRLGAPREALWPLIMASAKSSMWLTEQQDACGQENQDACDFPLYSFLLLLISLDPSQLLHNLSKRPPNVQPQLQTLTEYGQCCPQHWDPQHLPTESSPLKDLHLGAQVGWHPSVAQWWKWLLIHSPCFSEKLCSSLLYKTTLLNSQSPATYPHYLIFFPPSQAQMSSLLKRGTRSLLDQKMEAELGGDTSGV